MKKLFLIICLFITACSEEPKQRSSVISLSVSSDGQYVISAHHGRILWLWDLKNKSHKEISNDANIYSPYFIKGSDKFIWQEVETRRVHLSGINGKDIKIFNPGFDSYGEVISSDFNTYIASDSDWNVYVKRNDDKKLIKRGFDDFDGYGKLLNLSFAGNILATSGACGYKGEDRAISDGLAASDIYPKIPSYANYSFMNCVVLWDIEKGKAIYKLNGNQSKTHATLSPDGRYVVAGDEGSGLYVWGTQSGKRILRSASLFHGIHIGDNKWDARGLINQPSDFCQKISDYDCLTKYQINAIKFISNNQYFRFTEGVPYVVLYEVLDPRPKKYLSLGTNPEPATFGYDIPVDTAPEAGILVMGQVNNMSLPKDKNSGINVYQYDKKNQSLKLIWAPDGPKAFKRTLKTYE